MKVRILSEALLDLEEGFFFYQRQESGLGGYFLDSLMSDIDSLALFAGIHRKLHGYHRLLSKRFPYAVYYAVREEAIEVWRVLDCRQNPARLKRRLGGNK